MPLQKYQRCSSLNPSHATPPPKKKLERLQESFGDRPERGSREKAGRLAVVIHIGDTGCGVFNLDQI